MAPGPDAHMGAVEPIAEGSPLKQLLEREEAMKGTVDAAPGEPLLKFFQYEHLPAKLQLASAPFCEIAQEVARSWPRNPERTILLRKLLEAKDASVRCWL